METKEPAKNPKVLPQAYFDHDGNHAGCAVPAVQTLCW
jgi:hypothetical protein